ncbi:cell division cycle and apoptosis regulator protein 1-like isoform X4 [Cloeon dipterum]|uniref:cell division cycle and apoptosis regulator protein 1-like isoform X4 n=1 Tax=Cloeon dipterum TaxID=197152 RepID=UPI00322082CC
MSQFGTQGNNPPWARTNVSFSGQSLPPPLGQPGQMQAPPIMQHTLLSPQVSFQQQQQQVYQQSIQNMQQQQQQQQQQPAPGLIGQQIQLNADKSKGYAPPGIQCYPFQTPQLGGLGAAGGLQPLHSLQGTIPSTPQQGPISYPAPRSIRNFTNQPPPLTNVINSTPQPVPQQNQITPKNRVFNGVITKLHENFGFIDEEVFFNLSVVAKGHPPVVGERALVEASFNPSMPFKWNATKVQVLPSDRQNSNGNVGGFGGVPPPQFGGVATGGSSGGGNDTYGSNEQTRNRPAERRREVLRRGSRERDRDAERERERERRRDDRQKEREKEREKEKRSRLSRSPSEPSRRRSRSPRATRVASRSPPRRRARVMPRYVVQIPKISLEITEANMPELKRRYTNLYLPSDFFVSNFRWVDAFPAHRPFGLNKSCAFHVMHKDVNEIITNDAVLEPQDADYSFSAKVMLISIPVLEELYRKSCALAEDVKDGEERDGYVHPTRLINFLVGVRGKTKETMAIGGPWSQSLDGPNPDKDPSVLIKTAIRTCKALTGVDLSPCTQWYRFVEIYYHRSETTHKGKVIPPRVETVVLFLPDVWSCLPTRLEWESMQLAYKKQLCRKLKADEAPDAAAAAEPAAAVAAATLAAEEAPENQKEEEKMETDSEKKPEPTHFSELDVKVMKVSEMRLELEARTLNSKGLKSQLVARLTKALKTEQELEEAGAKAAEQAAVDKAAESEETSMDLPTESSSEKKEDGERSKSHEDKEKQARYERRFVLPENSHIIVHPSKTAKSGKFDCTLMSLSLLLDYRQEDTKEHSFEVSLFAELFNEMLRRDFGFRIYKAFVDFPEKPKIEEKEKSSLKHEKKEDEAENQDGKSEEKDAAEEDDDEKESCSSFGSKKKDAKDSKEKESKEKPVKKVKMVTIDPGLLLAFVYFDQSHCGYILNKDLEEIIHTLGLNLSRAQVKRLLLRVVTRDTFNYRKLTDRSEAELSMEAEIVEDDDKTKQLAHGNHRLLPIFASEDRLRQQDETSDKSAASSGVIIYNGCAVDVGKLLHQLERSEKSRVDTEEKMVQLEKQLVQAKDTSKASSENASKLADQLKDCKSRLSETEEGLKKEKENNTRYLTAINKVNEIVCPLVITKEVKN